VSRIGLPPVASGPELRKRKAGRPSRSIMPDRREAPAGIVAEDPDRGNGWSPRVRALPRHSKNRITIDPDPAHAARGRVGRSRSTADAMFRGEHINVSEDRRRPARGAPDAKDRSLISRRRGRRQAVHEVLDRMAGLSPTGRQESGRGTRQADPQRDQHRIGGSDLGP